jgi:uncharacterized protein YciU (UPF0263 family)
MSIHYTNQVLAEMELSVVQRSFEHQMMVQEAIESVYESGDENLINEMESELDDLSGAPEEDFDVLFDIAAEYVQDPEESEDILTLFSAYFAEMGGEHLKEVAASGISAVDSEFLQDLLAEMDYDSDSIEDAVAMVVELASAVLADASEGGE